MSKSFTKLEVEMKEYEKAVSNTLNQHKPIIIRIDGRAFHTFCSGLTKPFDLDLLEIFQETTKFLCEEMGATVGYCQSDEISLYIQAAKPESQTLFSGKQQKLVSISASLATAKFNQLLSQNPKFNYHNKLAVFDSRAFNLPDYHNMHRYFYWRQVDCKKNAISSIAYAYFSHKELDGKTTEDRIQMLKDIGINYMEYNPYFLDGTFFTRIGVVSKYSKEELDRLPEKHAARSNPDLMVSRHVYKKDTVIFRGW